MHFIPPAPLKRGVVNKILLQKVKDQCKDMGLSEAFINDITERMGGVVADDSTDEQAIETVANQIAEIARLSQGEATGWVDKNRKKNTAPKEQRAEPAKEQEQNEAAEEKPAETESQFEKTFAKYQKTMDARLKALEEQNASLIAERASQKRGTLIADAFSKHRIPEVLRGYINVPESIEESGIDGYVAELSQNLVTLQLPGMDSGVQTQPTAITKEEADNVAAKMLRLNQSNNQKEK